MNRIYRLVWSTTRHAWIAASEFATAHRKSGRSALVGAVAASLVCAPVMPAFAATPYKNGSAFEKTVSGNPGLYVNDASNDSGCIFVHDTGDTGSTGWKYDSNNTNCLTSDKASQTARVLFYGSGTRTDGTDSLTLGNELYVNGGRIGLNNKFGTNPTNSMPSVTSVPMPTAILPALAPPHRTRSPSATMPLPASRTPWPWAPVHRPTSPVVWPWVRARWPAPLPVSRATCPTA